MKIINCTNCGHDNKPAAKYCSGCGFELPRPVESIVEDHVSQIKVDKKKLSVSAIAGVVTFLISFYAVQHFFFPKPTFDKVLMETASELNKTCPVFIDKDTRLDNTLALPDKTLQYNYTLVNLTESEINKEEFKTYMQPILINLMKTNPDMKVYREHNATLAYNYVDKNGVFLLKLSITPEMYN